MISGQNDVNFYIFEKLKDEINLGSCKFLMNVTLQRGVILTPHARYFDGKWNDAKY